jgi:RNA polymerase sigma factor (sigma-70 family)
MSDVTRILNAIEQGDPHAADQLLPLVYAELRKLAAQKMAQEAPGQTLQATALVHEAYLRLVASPGTDPASPGTDPASPGRESGEPTPRWNGRGHFFAAAAEAMRRILVESARRKHRLRRGGGRKRLDLDRLDLAEEGPADSILALDEALERLAAEESTVAEVVKLRYFTGMTIEQTAAALGLSVRTANRHWAYAKAWLYQQLRPEEPAGG